MYEPSKRISTYAEKHISTVYLPTACIQSYLHSNECVCYACERLRIMQTRPAAVVNLLRLNKRRERARSHVCDLCVSAASTQLISYKIDNSHLLNCSCGDMSVTNNRTDGGIRLRGKLENNLVTTI